MPTKKKQLDSKRRRIVKFIVLPLALVALVLLGAIQLVRISNLEAMVRDLYTESLLHTINEYYNPLVVDGLQKQAYIPELGLVLPYDNRLTSLLRYMVYQNDTSTNNGTVQLSTTTEMRKSKPTDQGMTWNGCHEAFNLMVGTGDSRDDMKLVSQKIMHDGRKVALYESTADECGAFIASADGGTLINLLQQVESY
jgi:hypothetical protein